MKMEIKINKIVEAIILADETHKDKTLVKEVVTIDDLKKVIDEEIFWLIDNYHNMLFTVYYESLAVVDLRKITGGDIEDAIKYHKESFTSMDALDESFKDNCIYILHEIGE